MIAMSSSLCNDDDVIMRSWAMCMISSWKTPETVSELLWKGGGGGGSFYRQSCKVNCVLHYQERIVPIGQLVLHNSLWWIHHCFHGDLRSPSATYVLWFANLELLRFTLGKAFETEIGYIVSADQAQGLQA